MKAYSILYWTFEDDNWDLETWVEKADSKEALMNNLPFWIQKRHIVEVKEL